MGLEVGWYLRFARTDRIEALVATKAAEQVRHEKHIFPDWEFAIEEFEDHARAVMTRKKPLYGEE